MLGPSGLRFIITNGTPKLSRQKHVALIHDNVTRITYLMLHLCAAYGHIVTATALTWHLLRI